MIGSDWEPMRTHCSTKARMGTMRPSNPLSASAVVSEVSSRKSKASSNAA